MSPAWPRNIIPYTEDKLRALSTVASIELYEAALDGPLAESEIGPDQLELADQMVKAGLLRRERGLLVPTHRHRRDPDGDVPGVVEHKRAVVGYAQALLADTLHALDARGHEAIAGLGVVTLPDKPDVVARATTIIAEAEDQLRALAEEHPRHEGDRALRLMVFIGARE